MKKQNIRLYLGNKYFFSMMQETDHRVYPSGNVEVALIYKADTEFPQRVHPVDWCIDWVGDDYNDSVVTHCNGQDVMELLNTATEYALLKGNDNEL